MTKDCARPFLGEALHREAGIRGNDPQPQDSVSCLLLRLRNKLLAVMHSWGMRVHDAEDLASEVVLRTWLRFPRGASWRDLWTWGVHVARRLNQRLTRVCTRLTVCSTVGMPELVAVRASDCESLEAVARFRASLPACDRGTLELLRRAPPWARSPRPAE